MCELLGMSANVPTDICFSFTGLVKRGGERGPHRDGWGITFYEGKGCRTFKDALPSSYSPIAKMIQDYPIKSQVIIAHIRQANRGGISLENTHPFTRELWGRYWTFAHNGQLTDYAQLDTGFFYPVGQTDSEYAFCFLLNQLYHRYHTMPAWRELSAEIKKQAAQLAEKGVFNMLLSDGEYIIAYCATHLHWITRKAPFGQAKLLDEDIDIDFYQHTTPSDIVTIIATQPLTVNEQWYKIEPGQLVVFRYGELICD
ncbi:class II glutamine amidotransferase [Utexia brackfieldae]|uniref:class II glutamine amidotransferase n=1 Tax=Utexia brackfieldae TaxID=3074108 RepID=UPI00370D0C30